MSYYDPAAAAAIGACGPGCYPGQAAFPLAARAPGAFGFGPGFGMGPYDWQIMGNPYAYMGADPPVPAQPTGVVDRLKAAGEQTTFGIKNKNLALGAVAIGTIVALTAAGTFGK